MKKSILQVASALLGGAALFAGQVFAESTSVLISDTSMDEFLPTVESPSEGPTDADFVAAAGFTSSKNTKLVQVSGNGGKEAENAAEITSAEVAESTSAEVAESQIKSEPQTETIEVAQVPTPPTVGKEVKEPPAAEPAEAEKATTEAPSAASVPTTPTTDAALEEFAPVKSRLNVGGWLETGTWGNQYGNDSTVENGAPLGNNINNYGWHVQQTWLFAERKAENDGCGFDWGFRADAMFGTDAAILQSVHGGGFLDGNWNISGDGYGWALPQFYAELAMNRWNVKIGKFLTPVGYEAIDAPNKLFYTHSYAYNHEPATHSGVLGELAWNDSLTFLIGATTGNDTSFENKYGDFGLLAGATAQLTERLSFGYCMTWSRIHANPERDSYAISWDWPTSFDYISRGIAADEEMLQTIVLEWNMTERLTYAWQCNYGSISYENGQNSRTKGYEQIALVNYLTYQLTERLTLGGRFEWFRQNDLAAGAMGNHSRQICYELAGVAKYQLCKNLAFTGELRYDQIHQCGTYSDSELFGNGGRDNTQLSFGCSILATF